LTAEKDKYNQQNTKSAT